MEQSLKSIWEHIQLLCEQISEDIISSDKGSIAGNQRARKGLKLLKIWTSDAVKISLSEEKIEREYRKSLGPDRHRQGGLKNVKNLKRGKAPPKRDS